MSGGRVARVAVLVCAALAAGMQLAPASRVHAAEPVPVVGGSWYWQPQIASINTPAGPVASPAGPVPTPDVPTGDFAVTAILGQVNKESYFHLDATAIPQGSSVQQLTLTLKEDAAGDANALPNDGAGSVATGVPATSLVVPALSPDVAPVLASPPGAASGLMITPSTLG